MARRRGQTLGVSGIGELPSPDVIGAGSNTPLAVDDTQRRKGKGLDTAGDEGKGKSASKIRADKFAADAAAAASIIAYGQRRAAANIKKTQADADAEIAEMALDFERAELEASFEDKAAILAERTAQRERATRYAYASQGVAVDSDVAIKAGDYEKRVAQEDYNALKNRLTAQQLGLSLEEVNIGYNREIAAINSKYEKAMATIGLVNDILSSGTDYYLADKG